MKFAKTLWIIFFLFLGFCLGASSVFVGQIFYPQFTLSPKHKLALLQENIPKASDLFRHPKLLAFKDYYESLFESRRDFVDGLATSESETSRVYYFKAENLDPESVKLSTNSRTMTVQAQLITPAKEADNLWGSNGAYRLTYKKTLDLPADIDRGTARWRVNDDIIEVIFSKKQ